MANQQAMTLEAIMNIKRAVAREKDRFLDSDGEAPKTTNRTNKLKRRAEYYHEGEMGGRMPYKRKIDHAGYSRYILKPNPRRFDEEGYELTTDEEDEDADREAAQKNPYHGIYIDQLLMPITHAKDLQNHPSLSNLYKSETLPRMVRDTLEMVHRERKTLVDLRLLLEQLRGDQPWIPTGVLMRDDDFALFGTEVQSDGTFAAPALVPFENHAKGERLTSPEGIETIDGSVTINGATDNAVTVALEVQSSEHAIKQETACSGRENNGTEANGSQGASKDNDIVPRKEDETTKSTYVEPAENGEEPDRAHASKSQIEEEPRSQVAEEGMDLDESNTVTVAPETEPMQPALAEPTEHNNAEFSKSSNPPTPSAISSPGSSPPPRMQTRAQANAANGTPHLAPHSGSTSPAPPRPASPPLSIHPLYIPLPSALPNRDVGLPPPEAEELRRLLSVHIQKQEEVCRGADRLYQGLLKATRLRDTLWWWSRAEEHRGEMSDGEDWVDMEEWRLDEELRKGDAVVEDGAEEPGKKTRGRRVAG